MTPILVVYKKSFLDIYGQSPDESVRRYMHRNSADVASMRRSHAVQERTLATVAAELERRALPYEMIFRAELRPIAGRDLVIAVGGDGTFLEVSHYVDDSPLLGVNSDPQSSTGFYCTTTAETLGAVLDALDRQPHTRLHRLEVVLDDRPIRELVLNDLLFAHANPAASTRYRLEVEGEGRPLTYRSSGLLVCTAAGSTGWMYGEGGEVMPLEDDRLQFRSRGVRGEPVRFATALLVRSLTRLGKVYLDGPHLSFDCGLGSDLVVRQGRPLVVIGDLEAKRARFGR